MPWDSPLVPPFPIRFRDTEILTVCYRTHPAAIDRLLPPPLERMGDVVMIHILLHGRRATYRTGKRMQRYGGSKMAHGVLGGGGRLFAYGSSWHTDAGGAATV